MDTGMGPPPLVVRLTGRREEADHTLSIQLDKPYNWQFKAGQFIGVALTDAPPDDLEGKCRTFSMASAPHEDAIMVTTRLRGSAFKHVLGEAPLGTPVNIEEPYGNFALHNNATLPAVFLAGGSVSRRSAARWCPRRTTTVPHRMILFYSTRRPEGAAFHDELQALERCNARVTLIATMTDMAESQRPWAGHLGL